MHFIKWILFWINWKKYLSSFFSYYLSPGTFGPHHVYALLKILNATDLVVYYLLQVILVSTLQCLHVGTSTVYHRLTMLMKEKRCNNNNKKHEQNL
jgi:hypothetical protein